MSHEDMARSHVKQLVREAFGLDNLVADGDGDLPFPCGTAMFYASVIGEGRLLHVWSRAVDHIRVDKAVLAEINAANIELTLARVYALASSVVVEGCLPVESLRTNDVGALCAEVGTTADRLGSMLAAVHGGQIAFPEAHRADCESED